MATNTSSRTSEDVETNCFNALRTKAKPNLPLTLNFLRLLVAHRFHLGVEGGITGSSPSKMGLWGVRLNKWLYFRMLLFLHWQKWIWWTMNMEKVKTEELWVPWASGQAGNRKEHEIWWHTRPGLISAAYRLYDIFLNVCASVLIIKVEIIKCPWGGCEEEMILYSYNASCTVPGT